MQQGLRLSYRELLRQADEVARGLLQLGVQVRGAAVVLNLSCACCCCMQTFAALNLRAAGSLLPLLMQALAALIPAPLCPCCRRSAGTE